MREIMDSGKILIANLSKGKIGEDNSRLLGALLITKLQLAAMSRVDIPEEERRDFFLYVDEFQNFATEAFVNILSEARKYRLSLVLANQYIAQLEEMTSLGKSTRVRDAIFGNVGTIIVFRVGAEDAEFLEKEFQPEFTMEDLVNLEKYNICVKLMIDGVASSPFSAITLPKREKPQKSYKEVIIRISRERYGTPKKIIEEKIEKWAGTQIQVSPPQRQILYDTKCSNCGKKIKVPFLPDPSRTIYCKSCLKKLGKEETVSLNSLKTRNEKTKEKKKIDLENIKRSLEKILKKNEGNR
jgi:CxxC-x17-CxxC domain-containing protein